MKNNRLFMLGMAAMAFGLALAGCSGKAQAQTGGGNAATDVRQAAESVQGAAVQGPAGGGTPAAATNFVYELNKTEDGVVITGLQDDAAFGAHLVVPAEIEGSPVVAFFCRYSDDSAKSRNQPPLESVVFPDSIIYLGASGIRIYRDNTGHDLEADYEELTLFADYYWHYTSSPGRASFSGCKSLKSVVFPKNLKIIPSGFASGCPSLMPEGISWPESPEAIGPNAFSGNSFTELVIPDGVKFIGDTLGGAFSGSTTLKSLTIPDSIQIIGAYSFADSPELTTVKIPAHPIKYTITTGYLHSWAFQNCPKLSLAAQTAIADTGYPDF
jgi:hypothetical protein